MSQVIAKTSKKKLFEERKVCAHFVSLYIFRPYLKSSLTIQDRWMGKFSKEWLCTHTIFCVDWHWLGIPWIVWTLLAMYTTLDASDQDIKPHVILPWVRDSYKVFYVFIMKKVCVYIYLYRNLLIMFLYLWLVSCIFCIYYLI